MKEKKFNDKDIIMKKYYINNNNDKIIISKYWGMASMLEGRDDIIYSLKDEGILVFINRFDWEENRLPNVVSHTNYCCKLLFILGLKDVDY